MGIDATPFGDGKTIIGIVHISTVDAIFRDLDRRPISMEFHPYLGPSFFKKNAESEWIPDYPSKEWDNLWRQFEGWWDAKGKSKYGTK